MPAVRKVNGVSVGGVAASTPAAAVITGPYSVAPPPNPAVLSP